MCARHSQVRELFERRKDKLRERRAMPLQDTIVVRTCCRPQQLGGL